MTSLSILRKSLLLFLSVLVSLASIAQTSDPAAEAILKKVEAKYEAYKNLKIEYTQMIKNPESDLDQELNGTLYLMGDLFRIETAGQILMSDNEKLWVYFEEGNEVTIDFFNEEEVFKPSDIFSMYDKDFKYTKAGEARINGQMYDVLLFSPLSRDDYDIHTIRLYVNQNDYGIAKAEIKDKMNNLVIYQIDKVSTNLNIDESFFKFNRANYPEGLIVTDNTK